MGSCLFQFLVKDSLLPSNVRKNSPLGELIFLSAETVYFFNFSQPPSSGCHFFWQYSILYTITKPAPLLAEVQVMQTTPEVTAFPGNVNIWRLSVADWLDSPPVLYAERAQQV